MPTATSIDSFIGRGFTVADAESRSVLFATVDAAWHARVGGEPAWRWWVPGRLEVFGKHTDYAGGRTLVAAVPRGFAMSVGPRDDDVVRVVDARYGDEASVRARANQPVPRGWANYVNAVVTRFAANFPGAAIGADIVIANDLPRAAGVSSSSALIVGVASALAHRGRLAHRDEWRAAIETPLDRATYFGCIENGASFRTLGGTAGVGTEGGSEDHTAISLAKPGHLSQFSFVPACHLGDVALPPAWTFVVASSGVHASKAGEVKERFNRASRLARALVTVWSRHAAAPSSSLAGAIESHPDGAAMLMRWVVEAGEAEGFTAPELCARLEHFVCESARSAAAAAAMAAVDAGSLAALSDHSQRDAEQLLANQVPETVALARAAREVGAIAASSFGAGFGGSVWALLPTADAPLFGPAWIARYLAVCPHAIGHEWFMAPPSPAALALD